MFQYLQLYINTILRVNIVQNTIFCWYKVTFMISGNGMQLEKSPLSPLRLKISRTKNITHKSIWADPGYFVCKSNTVNICSQWFTFKSNGIWRRLVAIWKENITHDTVLSIKYTITAFIVSKMQFKKQLAVSVRVAIGHWNQYPPFET